MERGPREPRHGDRARLAAPAALVCVVAAGCHQFGPGAVNGARLNYNEIINRTASEQLLLNLVRLRYRDNPFFLEVGSVVTSFQFGAALGADGSPTANPYLDPLYPGVNYAERPTISYSPLQGSKFATQLLTPLSLDTLVLMYHSGWSVERVFLCCVQMMNGIKNAPSASGPTPDYVPTYEQSHQVAAVMRKLQKDNELQLGAVPGGDTTELAMRIAPAVWEREDGRILEQILGITPGRGHYPLTTNGSGRDPNSVGINTRSLLGVLFYLSQAVEVPARHEMEGLVTVTRSADGAFFDWSQVTGKVMRIPFSGTRPRHAAVRVSSRGTWYYIADNDLNSKSTFSLIAQLFSLQAGQIRTSAPLLTLSAGG